MRKVWQENPCHTLFIFDLLLCDSLLSLILRTELANCLGSAPHFHVVHSLKLSVKLLTVVWLRVRIDRNLSLVTSLNREIKPLHNRLDSLAEPRSPIQSTTLCCCRTVCLHPVHTLLGEERHKTLCKLLNSLVESLRRRVTMLTKNLILSLKQSLNSTHQ